MEANMLPLRSLLCTAVVCHFIGVYTVPLKDNKTEGKAFPPKNSSASPEACCERQSKRIIAGYDTSRRPIYLDVGHCKQTCLANSVWFEDNKHGADSPPSCPSSSTCIPTKINTERYSLLEGPVDHEIIQDCHCVKSPSRCTRQKFIKVYFLNTPYETEVDVGMCSGQCRKNQKSCQPKHNKTISIKGPNGSELVSVIRRCHCAGHCYRMRYVQVYDETYLDNTTWHLMTRRKTIDVGMCSGTCRDSRQNRCLKWSKLNPNECLNSLKNRNKDCVPTSFKTHDFKTTDYEERTVLSVKSCGCRRSRTVF